MILCDVYYSPSVNLCSVYFSGLFLSNICPFFPLFFLSLSTQICRCLIHFRIFSFLSHTHFRLSENSNLNFCVLFCWAFIKCSLFFTLYFESLPFRLHNNNDDDNGNDDKVDDKTNNNNIWITDDDPANSSIPLLVSLSLSLSNQLSRDEIDFTIQLVDISLNSSLTLLSCFRHTQNLLSSRVSLTLPYADRISKDLKFHSKKSLLLLQIITQSLLYPQKFIIHIYVYIIYPVSSMEICSSFHLLIWDFTHKAFMVLSDLMLHSHNMESEIELIEQLPLTLM